MIDLPGARAACARRWPGCRRTMTSSSSTARQPGPALTLNENGLSACDSVLIPVQCEYYALEGLSELISTSRPSAKVQPLSGHRAWCSRCSPALQPHRCPGTGAEVYFGSKCTKPRSPVRSASLRPQLWAAHQFIRAQGQGSEATILAAIELGSRRTTGRTSQKDPRAGKSARNRRSQKRSGRLKHRGKQQEQWQKEKEDLAAGWKVCLRTP